MAHAEDEVIHVHQSEEDRAHDLIADHDPVQPDVIKTR